MEEINPETRICRGPLCEGIEKSITDFSPKASICKKCNCHKIKEHYKKNDRAYRKFKNEIKENSKCAECGISDIRVLEFDHHKGVKNINMCKSFSREKIKSELEFTQVLCTWCHRLKTRQTLDEKMKETDKLFTITDRPTSIENGKTCVGAICKGQLQYKTQFYNTKKKSYCKICISWLGREKRLKNYNFLSELKLAAKECALCKKEVTPNNITCFNYDHIDPKTKTTTIATYVRLNYIVTDKILEESKKCRLLCCNCHKIHTAHQLNYKMTETIENPDT